MSMSSKPKPPYMNDTTTKSPRYKHLRFFRLAVGERLDINSVTYKKVSAFSARHSLTGARRCVMPWDKVRSTRLVKPEPAPIVKAYDKLLRCEPWPPNMGCQGDPDPRIAEHYNAVPPYTKEEASGGDRTPESIGGGEKTPSS